MNIRLECSACREQGQGREIIVPPPAPARGHVIELMEALKESMKTVPHGRKELIRENAARLNIAHPYPILTS
jgi:hypothetical protein